MSSLDYELYFILFALLLFSALTLRLFYLKTNVKQTSKSLDLAHRNLRALQEQLQHLESAKDEEESFSSNLNKAELITHLQKSRLHNKNGDVSILPPERYRYIRSLIESGLDSQKIATTLSISNQEAEQLVTLSRLSQRKEVHLMQ